MRNMCSPLHRYNYWLKNNKIMKLKAIIGAVLAVAAAFRLLCLTGIIPLTFISSQWEAQWEPYFAAGVVLFVGAFICYDALKGMKK